MADEVIEWDQPLNTEEEIEWENNLTQGIPTTAFQTQRQTAAAAPSPYAPKMTYTAGMATPAAQSPFPDIDTQTGADFGTQQGMGLAPDGSEQDMLPYLQRRMSDIFKRPVKVRMGPQTGQPEFFSPKTQKWTTANPSSLSALGIDLGIGLPATLAGTAAGSATGNPVGAVAGAVAGGSAGSALSRVAKTAIAKKAGVLPEFYPLDTDVGHDAAVGAAFEVGSQAVLGAAKYARYWFKGAKAFGSQEATELGVMAAKADKIVAEIERRTGEKFNPTAGQRASVGGGETTEVGQKALSYDAATLKDPTTANKMRSLIRSNEDVLTDYFDAVTDPLMMRAVGAQYSADLANERVAKGLTQGYDQLLDSARKVVSQLPPELPAGEAGKIMRSALAQADKSFKDNIEDPAWAKYRESTGYNPETFQSDIRIPISDEVWNLMQRWDSRKSNALIGAIRKENTDLKITGKEKGGWVGELDWDEEGMPVFKSLTRKDDVDLTTLDDTIKWLRNEGRDALKNQQGVTYSERDLIALRDKLVDMRNSYLQESRPEVFDLLQQAESATKLRASQFRTGVIDDMLVKDGTGSYRLSDADAVYKIITRHDDTAAKQFAELTKGYPEAKQQAQQIIYALYRRAVIDPKTGAPNPKAHANFMSDYGQVARQFFDTPDLFTRMGAMGTQIAREQAALKKVMPQLQKLFGGELETLNAAQMSKMVLRESFSPEKVKLATSILRKNGQEQLIEEWQHSVLNDLGKQLIKDGQVNASALTKMLNGPQAKTVETLLNSGSIARGRAYINDLKTLEEAVNMIRTKGEGAFESQSRGLLVRLARLVFPQFSTESKLVTFGTGQRTKAVPGEIYNAITDPTALSRLAQESRKTMNQIKKAAVVGKISEVIADGYFNY